MAENSVVHLPQPPVREESVLKESANSHRLKTIEEIVDQSIWCNDAEDELLKSIAIQEILSKRMVCQLELYGSFRFKDLKDDD